MARSHLWATSGIDLGVSAVDLGRRRTTSVTGVHLWCTKTTTENVSATAADHDDNLIHGAFEASYSVKDLADELHVSAQTIYDLHTHGLIGVHRIGRRRYRAKVRIVTSTDSCARSKRLARRTARPKLGCGRSWRCVPATDRAGY